LKRAALGSSDDPYPAHLAEIRGAGGSLASPTQPQLTFAEMTDTVAVPAALGVGSHRCAGS
jgi:hypothetical protein